MRKTRFAGSLNLKFYQPGFLADEKSNDLVYGSGGSGTAVYLKLKYETMQHSYKPS